jgi:hypothetical protein
MDISIIGGTGDEGFGLTLRLAKAGNHVTIGSRSQEKGEAAAARARGLVGDDAKVDGTTNEQAAASAEVVVVTVPFEGQAQIYRSIKAAVPAGDRRGLHEPAGHRRRRHGLARGASLARLGRGAGQGDLGPRGQAGGRVPHDLG